MDNSFVNVDLETEVLREIMYWGATGSRDPISDYKLSDERELFTDIRAMAWAGMLYGYSQNGVIEYASAINAVPGGETRDEVMKWALGDSLYASYELIPWDDYIAKLKTLSACRAVSKTVSLAKSIHVNPDTVRSVAYQMCCELEGVVVGNIKADSIGEQFDEYTDVMRNGGTWATGLSQLDRIGRLGGYYTIIGARSHHGKTAVITSMMLNQLLSGWNVFMWQGEQTKAQMYMRFVCQMTGLSAWKVLNPIDAQDKLLIQKARVKIDSWLAAERDKTALYMYDGRRSVFEVLRWLRAARQRHSISIAYLDQLSKFSRDQRVSRESAYSDISESLAVESLKMKQPIALAHQLNIKERKDASGPPAFWQVKDCGRLYEDCDIWITVDRPEVDSERMVEFDRVRDKSKAKGDLEAADRFDVRGRVKIKVEKDRVATFGCHEEWMGFDHECGKVFSRFGKPDPLHYATRVTQVELGLAPADGDPGNDDVF